MRKGGNKLKIFFLSMAIMCFFGCSSLRNKGGFQDWVKKEPSPNCRIGYSTGSSIPDHALSKAFEDALRKFLEEIGIRVKAEYEEMESVEGNLYDVNIRSKTETKAKGTLRNVRRVKEHFEKSSKKVESYDAWVLVCLPEGEIERAREEIREFNEKLLNEAMTLFNNAYKLEKTEPSVALSCYEDILRKLEDVDSPEAITFSAIVRARLKEVQKQEDLFVKILTLKGNREIIKDAELVDNNGHPAGEWIDVGHWYKLRISLKDRSFVYLLDYDDKSKEMLILFPNQFEKENFIKEGFYPSSEDVYFEAREPAGLNRLIVIASDVEYSFNDNVIREGKISKELLHDFILFLQKHNFDVKRVDFYIRRR